MVKPDSPSDSFKRAVTLTMRAIAENHELTVSFGAEAPGLDGTAAKLPQISRQLTAGEVGTTRGMADSYALRLRHNDPKMHGRLLPKGGNARSIFESAETARVESLGSRRMRGVAQNIRDMLEDRCRTNRFDQAVKREEVPMAEAVGFLVRERLTGAKPPKAARKLVELWRPWIEKKAGRDLAALVGCMDDQEDFALAARQLIADLDLADELGEISGHEYDQDGEDLDGDSDAQAAAQAGEDSDDAGGAEMDVETAETAEGESPEQAGEVGEDMSLADGGSEEAGTEERPRASDDGAPGPDFKYSVFTTDFDQEVNADELCEPDELDRLRGYLDQHLQPQQSAVARLANRLQRRLLAKQNRSWVFDLEEGTLDAARLSRVIIDPFQPLTFKTETEVEFRDTVVTLLIDNSGSMRGRPITIAAMCADILARTLERSYVKVEILGFTTRAWKGGQ